ncbi:MAG: hypothetical protein OXE59_04725 [Bacteroidetes bacterium]|nr:hypothetical protein [Bacteroidota bacterium]MCY4233028.1 hypothetical protein [Bacteroidota bacterium]
MKVRDLPSSFTLLALLLLVLLIPACDSLQQQDQRIVCPQRTVPAYQDLSFVGEVSALRNEGSWGRFYEPFRITTDSPFRITAYTDSENQTMSIVVTVSRFYDNVTIERLIFPSIPKRLGTYSLNEFSTRDTHLSVDAYGALQNHRWWQLVDQSRDTHPSVGANGMDADSTFNYYLDTSEGGYISVDSYESQSPCSIKGTFDLTLIRNPIGVAEDLNRVKNILDFLYNDTLRITDGKFHAPVVRYQTNGQRF